jgi:hypothetical protein
VASEPSYAGRHRREWTWASLAALVLAIVVTAVAAWNPWNLVLVGDALFRPIVAGVVVAGAACWLCHLHVGWDWLRPLVYTAAGGTLVLWAATWVAIGRLGPDGPVAGVADNADNDVVATLRSGEASVTIWLRAERGLLTRENEVGFVPSTLSGHPTAEATFTSADELVVRVDGASVRRIRFDPHDLAVVDAGVSGRSGSGSG